MAWWGWLLLLGLVVGVGGRLWAAEPAPNISVPPLPPPPSPNAAAYYKRALDDLLALAKRSKIGKPLWDPIIPGDDTPQYSPTQREAYLVELAPAAQLIREGQRYQCGLQLRKPDGSMEYFNSAVLRELTRYLHFESQTHMAAFQWEAAISSALDGLHLGTNCIQDGSLLYVRIGTVLVGSVRKDAWECVDHLTAPQARAATTRLQAIIADEPSLAEVLRRSKVGEQRTLLAMIKQPRWRDEYLKIHKLEQATPPVRLTDGMKDLIIPYSNEMDLRIAEAEKPYALRRTLPAPRNPVIVSFFGSAFNSLGCWLAQHQAQERLLLLALTLRAYQQEHDGAYPATLQALAPTYLPTIPDDPFAPAGPVQYRLLKTGYQLYSLGPDGKDDKGKPITGEITATSHGDIVAGVNR